MAETTTGKIKRKFMANYTDAVPPSEPKEPYARLGRDPEEYIVEMSASVETKNNIWGETSIILDSYQPQVSVEPHYVEIGESLFERLQGIMDEQQTLDDLKTSVVEVHLWDLVEAADGTYVAYKGDAIIEVSSYGGDAAGYRTPFNVHHNGNRVKDGFVFATKTFTADT